MVRGIMMITNAAVQGGYEVLILGWSKVCLQTYSLLFPGIIALISVIISKKELTQSEKQY